MTFQVGRVKAPNLGVRDVSAIEDALSIDDLLTDDGKAVHVTLPCTLKVSRLFVLAKKLRRCPELV